MHIRPFELTDEDAVIALWERCDLTRPWNDPRKDIHRKLAVQPEWFLVGTLNDEIVATAMAGYDGHRGWVYYVGVSPEYRRRGFGRMIMEEAERLLKAAGCPKLNLMVRRGNSAVIDFYKRREYSQDAVATLSKRLITDESTLE